MALLLLPVLAKNTYISENALMPGPFITLKNKKGINLSLIVAIDEFFFFFALTYIGSANPMLSGQDVSEANILVKEVIAINSKSRGAGMYVLLPCIA